MKVILAISLLFIFSNNYCQSIKMTVNNVINTGNIRLEDQVKLSILPKVNGTKFRFNKIKLVFKAYNNNKVVVPVSNDIFIEIKTSNFFTEPSLTFRIKEYAPNKKFDKIVITVVEVEKEVNRNHELLVLAGREKEFNFIK